MNHLQQRVLVTFLLYHGLFFCQIGSLRQRLKGKGRPTCQELRIFWNEIDNAQKTAMMTNELPVVPWDIMAYGNIVNTVYGSRNAKFSKKPSLQGSPIIEITKPIQIISPDVDELANVDLNRFSDHMNGYFGKVVDDQASSSQLQHSPNQNSRTVPHDYNKPINDDTNGVLDGFIDGYFGNFVDDAALSYENKQWKQWLSDSSLSPLDFNVPLPVAAYDKVYGVFSENEFPSVVEEKNQQQEHCKTIIYKRCTNNVDCLCASAFIFCEQGVCLPRDESEIGSFHLRPLSKYEMGATFQKKTAKNTEKKDAKHNDTVV